jgi:hypothetical protein
VLLQKPKELDIPIEDYYSGNHAPLPPSQRSDWRLRATSRTNRTQLDGHRHRRYVKRANPPHIQVQQGEPFFEEIQAYNKQFVPFLNFAFSLIRLFTAFYPYWSLNKLKMKQF